jgi:DNA-binding NtrC family response regulator
MATILIVEDDEQVRVLAESILRDLGYETLTASDVEQALAVLNGEQSIDVLFTDIGLKGEKHGGVTVGRAAANLRSGLRVLYTSGEGITDAMKAMFVAGATLLPKPYTPADLSRAIGKLAAPK